MRFRTLGDWLAWQETLHPSRIELGLERVRSVWSRLYAAPEPSRLPCAVVTVAGTNGKGSCVAYLEACYQAAGYRSGAYTSPHLLRYNERVRLDGEPVTDEALCQAFARIDKARAEVALTYFEFGTLAALDLFVRADLDVVILEVGLGGRLDATNLIDADLALIASIGRDHMAWLGEDLAAIAREKAGVVRPARPAVIGQRAAPSALRERIEQLGAMPLQLGREFDWVEGVGGWDWQGPAGAAWQALPVPALRGRHQYDNAAAVLCTLHQLAERLPLSPVALRQGLLRARLPGRFTVLPGRPTWILDVAHNEGAAAVLAETLRAYPCAGRRLAVLSLLADKEAEAVIAPLAPLIADWYLAPLPSSRAMALATLRAAFTAVAPAAQTSAHAELETALRAAAEDASDEDLILVFGSFQTVEAALRSTTLATV